jgi:hypothetical protein
LIEGIRHEGNGNGDSYQYDNNNDSFDFGSDDFSDDSSGNDNEEKPASEIEKSFHEKLSQGNESVADTSLGSFSEDDFDKKTISLDEPLFEEESK